MTFVARLVRHTAIWRAWKQQHRTGGEIAGVRFHAAGPADYETGDLTHADVAKLNGVVGVMLVSFGGDPPAAAAMSVAAPVEPPLPPVEIGASGLFPGRTDGSPRQPVEAGEGRLTIGRTAASRPRQQARS